MAARSTALRKIKIMISSQCNRQFPDNGRTLTEIRRELSDRIQAQKLFGLDLFEVWINEDSPGRGTNINSWDACLTEVRKADILIVLNAGHGGWAPSDGDIGICHAELMTAHNSSPAKVRIIPLTGTQPLPDELATTNTRFKAYVDRINPFAPSAKTEAMLFEAVDKAVADAVTSLVGLGVRDASKGGFSLGDALAWSRLSFEERAVRMRATMAAALVESGGTAIGTSGVAVEIAGGKVMIHLHAAPASLSVAQAREYVGRPFLADHDATPNYGRGIHGPLHVIACQAGVTAAQARSLLGFPDATIVTPGFGIFVADEVQQIQFALLRDCRDDTSTRSAIHRLRGWLVESGEDQLVLERAQRRRIIADTIAAQLSASNKPRQRKHAASGGI
ncbi:hypothetical protein [Aminobacter sp. HY435]|uniref:hypothetical protein n=1 Tax=Aminobacter sp. HY435 TaxID=2970917 RepID=UPI0022B979B2|nr:hypothetical protein [Aminobacter sp. HY435]